MELLWSAYDEVVRFFENRSALVNFLAITTVAITLIGWLKRDVIGRWLDPSNRSVTAWVDAHLGSTARRLNDAAVTSAKIAIVDDQPEHFPLDYLRGRGYRIAVFTDMPLASASTLQAFDLLILDVAGVVPEDPRRGGLHLIRKAKEGAHPPIVVAVSGKSYDPTVTEFFRLSDAQLKKPVGVVEFEEKIRGLLDAALSPHALAQRIDGLIATSTKSRQLRSTLTRAAIDVASKRKTAPHDASQRVPAVNRANLDLLLSRLRDVSAFYEVS